MSGSPKAPGLNGLKQKKRGFVVVSVHFQRKWVECPSGSDLGNILRMCTFRRWQAQRMNISTDRDTTGKVSILIPIFNLNLMENTLRILWYPHLQPQLVMQR